MIQRCMTPTVLSITLCCALAASASPITMIFQGTGAGAIGSTTFSTRSFVITAQGDTASRQDESVPGLVIYQIVHTSAKIEISGLGTFAFVTPTQTFVNQTNIAVGFSRPSLDLFDESDAAFGAWNMLTSLGPIAATGALLQWEAPSVQTSGGVLRFDNSPAIPSTFQAIVPEPASGLLAAAMLFAGSSTGRAWRKLRRNRV